MPCYESIWAECMKKGEKWIDPDFKAEQTSIYYKKEEWMPDWSKVVWKRPAEICSTPLFVVAGKTKFNVHYGEKGSSPFLASLSVLSNEPRFLEYVVPPDQTFDDKYTGVFRFNFWRFGRWEEVIIDDRLPTIDGKLVFCQHTEHGEFWAALLEKAYAKVLGSYQSINKVASHDLLVDYTGGMAETIDLKNFDENKDHLFRVLKYIFEMNSLICCCTEATRDGDNENEGTTLSNGMVTNCIYCVTNIVEFVTDNQPVKLFRCLNPRGKTEWSGDWSDGSKQWANVSLSILQSYDLETRNDGEFWMCLEDFLKNYHALQICHLTPESKLAEKKEWIVTTYHAEWTPGVNAGGRRENEDDYWTNPQFIVTLRNEDRSDMLDKCSLIVSLMETSSNDTEAVESSQQNEVDNTVGFDILQFKRKVQSELESDQFNGSDLEMAVKMKDYKPRRELTGRYELDPGQYCVMPHTYQPDTRADFLLRIATEGK